MNTAQLYMDPEMEEDRRDLELPVKTSPQRHNYNLRLRPTRPNTRYSMMQSGNSQKKLAKPNIHIM